MAGRLIVCPSPIGNIGDVSPRVREALADADLVACEDTRRAGRLYERLDLDPPRFVSNHDSNEDARAPQLAKAIERGARVALLSDAGTPVLSDPGYRLIQACIERGIEIEVLPGPTAITTALVASGLPADRWRFEGFLPRRAGELERVLQLAVHRQRLLFFFFFFLLGFRRIAKGMPNDLKSPFASSSLWAVVVIHTFIPLTFLTFSKSTSGKMILLGHPQRVVAATVESLARNSLKSLTRGSATLTSQ